MTPDETVLGGQVLSTMDEALACMVAGEMFANDHELPFIAQLFRSYLRPTITVVVERVRYWKLGPIALSSYTKRTRIRFAVTGINIAHGIHGPGWYRLEGLITSRQICDNPWLSDYFRHDRQGLFSNQLLVCFAEHRAYLGMMLG